MHAESISYEMANGLAFHPVSFNISFNINFLCFFFKFKFHSSSEDENAIGDGIPPIHTCIKSSADYELSLILKEIRFITDQVKWNNNNNNFKRITKIK